MIRLVARLVWNTSEFLEISLGKYAPRVFETMVGVMGDKYVR